MRLAKKLDALVALPPDVGVPLLLAPADWKPNLDRAPPELLLLLPLLPGVDPLLR